MTDQQRAEVWQRRDNLLAQLNYVTDDDEAEQIKTQIESCNLELTADTYSPPNEDSESE